MVNRLKKEKYDLVRKLRKNGKGFSDISNRTAIPKSTVRLWCKDISLTNMQKVVLKKNHQAKSTKTILEVQSRRKVFLNHKEEELLKLGKEDLFNNRHNPLFFLALGLYWGEGYKKGNKEVAITNSDPRILNITINFFKEFYSINETNLRARLTINSIYKGNIDNILDYWSKEVGIPLNYFTKTHFVSTPFKREYSNKNHKGTLRIKILKPLNIRSRLLSSINSVDEYLKSI